MSQSSSSKELLAEVQAKSKALNGPLLLSRLFVEVDEGTDAAPGVHNGNLKLASTGKPEGSIRVLQWNILAQGLCLCSDSFVLCPREALLWERRQNYVIEELLTHDADILFLEEVDKFDFIASHMSAIGFKGVFCPKPDSPCLYQENNCGPDGCAIFWRETHFTLTSKEDVVIRDDKEEETNQVALMCWFKGQHGSSHGKDILAVCTHLKAKRNYSALRFEQGKFLERELLKRAQGKPLIFCGDFNALPEEKVIELIKSSKLDVTSAYTLLSPSQAEPEYTTWKVRSLKGSEEHEETSVTIDYIFFSKKNIKCLQLLQIPTGAELGKGFLPSHSFPSDHLSLVIDLVFT